MDHKKQPGVSDRRIDEIARQHDVVQRARAARPVNGGEDRLDQPLDLGRFPRL